MEKNDVPQSRRPLTRLGTRSRSGSRLRRGETLAAMLFLLPNITGFLVFTIGTLGASIGLSLTEWNLLSSPVFVGMRNYVELMHDPVFWKAIINTIYYAVVSVPLGIMIALPLAVALNQSIRGVLIYRTIYFLPVVSSTVAVALLWQWLYHPRFGMINYLLGFVNLPPLDWIYSPTWAMPAIVIMSVWKGLGYNIILFLAGLQGIPKELYEAARIDGATGWRQFWKITLPLLTPTTFFILVISIIGSFQVFEQAFIMTRGGPAYATTTIVYYIYLNGFEWFKMGMASANAWILFMMILVVTLAQWAWQKRWVFYG